MKLRFGQPSWLPLLYKTSLTRRCGGVLLALLLCASIALLFPMSASADGGAPNLAYVAGTSSGISVIDISQQKVTSTISVPGDPHAVLLSLDGRFLYVTQPALNRVSVIAARTGQTICSASVPGQPSLLGYDPGTNILYTAGHGAASVTGLDATTCAVKHTIKTSGGVYGLAVAVVGNGTNGGNGNQLWVADTHGLAYYDATGKQLGSIPVAGGAGLITIPVGPFVYSITQEGSIIAVDLNTFKPSGPLITGGPFGTMDFDETTGEIYVPDQQHNQIDVLAPLVSGEPIPHEPERVIALGVTPESIAITADGQLGFVALSGGNVAMLDIPGRQLVNTILVGGNPHFIITGLYPPIIGTTPQQASTWSTIATVAAYVLIIALILIPVVLFRRFNRGRVVKKEE